MTGIQRSRNGVTTEADVYRFYAARGERRKIIELQDIFHGKRTEDIFADADAPYRKVRQSRMGGVTVLYEPPEDFIENIRTYADELDALLLYDNSRKSHQEMIGATFGDKVQYMWNGGRNKGLPYVFNDAAEMLSKDFANPLKAVAEFVRILKPGGYLVIVVPFKEKTFDHRRPYTAFEHLLEDYKRDIDDDDLTHLPEIAALHDYEMDTSCGGRENFLRRSKENFKNCCLHQHVFSEESLRGIYDYF